MLLTPRIIRTHELTAERPQPDLRRHAEQHGHQRPAAPDQRRGRWGRRGHAAALAPMRGRPLGAAAPGAGAAPPASPFAAPGTQPGADARRRRHPAPPRAQPMPPTTGVPVATPGGRGSRPSCRQGPRPFRGRPACRSRRRRRRAASRCSSRSSRHRRPSRLRRHRRRICSACPCRRPRRARRPPPATPPAASPRRRQRRPARDADARACSAGDACPSRAAAGGRHAARRGRDGRGARHAESSERDAGGQWPVHGAGVHLGRVAALRGDHLDHVQPGAAPRAQRVRRHVHAPGRRHADVHAAGGSRSGPHRHRHRPRRRSGRRLDRGPAGGDSVRAGGGRHRHAERQRLGHAGRRRRGDRCSSRRRESWCASHETLHPRTRLLVRGTAGGDHDRADPGVGGAAAGARHDSAPEGSGAAPGAARDARRHRQVQGCGRSGHDSDDRAEGQQRRLSARARHPGRRACRWPTTRRGGS